MSFGKFTAQASLILQSDKEEWSRKGESNELYLYVYTVVCVYSFGQQILLTVFLDKCWGDEDKSDFKGNEIWLGKKGVRILRIYQKRCELGWDRDSIFLVSSPCWVFLFVKALKEKKRYLRPHRKRSDIWPWPLRMAGFGHLGIRGGIPSREKQGEWKSTWHYWEWREFRSALVDHMKLACGKFIWKGRLWPGGRYLDFDL